MDFMKLLGGNLDPNSSVAQLQAEAIKGMAQDFFKSEKGKKLLQFIITQSVPAMEQMKTYMKEGNGKCFLVYMDDDAPAFVELDSQKSLDKWEVDADAILKFKKLDNVGELIQSFISGEMFKSSEGTQKQVETTEQKAIETEKK